MPDVFVRAWRAQVARLPQLPHLRKIETGRQGVPASVREFTTWEGDLRAVGLDPSTAAELRRAERSGD